MAEHGQGENLYQIEGPTYQDGAWRASVTLIERKFDIQGETQEEVQERILHYLGQQALEIEKARIVLRKAFEDQSDKQEGHMDSSEVAGSDRI